MDTGGNLDVGFVEFWREFGRDISHLAGVRLSELGVAGVCKAGPNEGTGFASTLARIFWIDKAAFVSKALVGLTPSAGENLKVVGGCYLTDVSANLVTNLKDFAEDREETLAAVKAKKGSD